MMQDRRAGLIKAKTTNREDLREIQGNELMQNYLGDEAMTRFEAFVAVSGETHFSPSQVEHPGQGFEHSCQAGCGFLGQVVVSWLMVVPHLQWSPAQHGVPFVKPLCNIIFS